MSSPLHLSYMCKNLDSLLKFSIGLGPVVFSPHRTTSGKGPKFSSGAGINGRALAVILEKTLMQPQVPQMTNRKAARALTTLISSNYKSEP